MEESLYAFFTRTASDWRNGPCLLCRSGRQLRCPFGRHCTLVGGITQWPPIKASPPDNPGNPGNPESKPENLAEVVVAPETPAQTPAETAVETAAETRDETLLSMREFLARRQLPYPRTHLCWSQHHRRRHWRGNQRAGKQLVTMAECENRNAHTVEELLAPFDAEPLRRYMEANLARQCIDRKPRLPLRLTAREQFCCHLCGNRRVGGVIQLHGTSGALRAPIVVLRCNYCPARRPDSRASVVTYVCLYEPADAVTRNVNETNDIDDTSDTIDDCMIASDVRETTEEER